jgi:hypothetical protein
MIMCKNDEIHIPNTRICSSCGINKLLDNINYSVDRSNKFGFRHQCKICANISVKIYREHNGDKIKERNKKYRDNCIIKIMQDKENKINNSIEYIICNTCNISKELNEKNYIFANHINKDGKRSFALRCRSCQRIKNNKNRKNDLRERKPEILERDKIKEQEQITGERKCSICKCIKLLDNNNFRQNEIHGKIIYNNRCIECYRDLENNRKKQKRRLKQPKLLEIDKSKEIESLIDGRMCHVCKIIKPLDNKNYESAINRAGKITFRRKCRKCVYLVKTKSIMVWVKNKRKNDPAFKLRNLISSHVRYGLSNSGVSKNGESCWKYLPYTPQQLKSHLESLFESWMNWQNRGLYKTDEWDDNNINSWKWQLDHIIPHSEFKYTSMEDEEFKKCWALSNLRPYSAKQNLLDGVNRTRHIKIS